MNNFNPQDIASWFREQAKKFNEIANQVENTFNGTLLNPAKAGLKENSSLWAGPLSAEQVKTYVSVKSQRVVKIAKHFGASEKAVRDIINDEANGLQIAERGWVKPA